MADIGMNELVSVVVPVYNPGKYLDRCLHSLRQQTYSNLEIILVDDGSTDGSGERCDEYVLQDSRIHVIHKENGGAASARNRGIDVSTGTYLVFIDADDYVDLYFVEILYRLCKKNNCLVSICDLTWTTENHLNFTELNPDEKEFVSDSMQLMYRCCNKNKIKETIICNKMYRRDLFEDLRYPEGVTYEDLATTHKILYHAGRVAETTRIMYAYYKSENSVTRRKYSLLNFDSENKAQDERAVFFHEIGDMQLFEHAIISIERNRIANYCKCARYLPDCKQERHSLRQRFVKDYKYIRRSSRLGGKDSILFKLFLALPWVCVHLLWPIYNKQEMK